MHRSFRRRHCSRVCFAVTSAPARRDRSAVVDAPRGDGARRHLRPARRADSRATASMPSWVVPHFEKMLYDNALLLRFYAHWARRTGNPLARTVAARPREFISTGSQRDGMFTSALDADTDGRRGSDLCVDAGAVARGARRRGRSVGPQACSGSPRPERSSTAASVLQLLVDPDDAARFDRVVRRWRSPATAAAARPRRQSGHRLERLAITALAEASDRAGRARFARRRAAVRRRARRPAHGRREASARQPRRRGRRLPPRFSRTTPRSRPAADAVPDHR